MSQAAGYFTNSGPGGFVQTLTGNTGGAVPPTGGNINVVGTGVVSVAGNPGTSTLTISVSGTVADSFPTDSGTATPSGGVLNIIAGLSTFNCGATVEFTGSGNTVELHVSGTGNAHNTLIGLNSGQFLSSGTGNTGLGYASLNSNPTGLSGSFNTCIGELAGGDITAGASNCAFGAFALQNGNPGSFNIVAGFQAANNWTGGEDSNIIIGHIGVASESNTIRIGTTGGISQRQNKCYIAGIDGVNLATANVVVEASDQLGTAVITAGTGISVTAGANTITIASSTPSGTYAYTNVNSSPYVVLSTDVYLSVDSSGGPITVQLANAATSGRFLIIKDRTGSASTNNITVTTVGGAVNIDGAATFVMNTAYESINVMGNSSTYEVF